MRVIVGSIDNIIAIIINSLLFGPPSAPCIVYSVQLKMEQD